jgi:type VII secretion protein EccB
MEHALVRGDVRMLDDPQRAQSLSLIAGCVLAAIAVAACAILAVLQPRGAVGSASIVMVRESGALYVRIGDTVHPVLNLSSARLIAGTSGEPELVSPAAIGRAKRGPLVGIPGAPDAIPRPLGGDESEWTICDDTTTTTVIIGALAGRLDDRHRALVTPRGESAAMTYLLYDGRRAKVDLRNPVVVRALRLDGIAPRPVSRALLDAVPEMPEIFAPSIAKLGTPSILRGFPVGTVVRLNRAGSVEFYVALADGVQRIGEVTADLIRFMQPNGRRDIVSVAPGVIGGAPTVDDLPVATFPQSGGVADHRVLCTQWSWSQATGSTNTVVLVGNSLPIDNRDTLVELAQADGPGPEIDNAALPPGRGAFVRGAGVEGQGGATGALYLVCDSGVVFGVHDEEAAKRLGLTDPMVPAPWPVLAQLPRGPELSVQAASIVRDSVGPPS